MREKTTADNAFIRAGLRRLQEEAFSQGGLGFGAEEVVSTSITRYSMSRRGENILRDGQWGFREIELDFSREAMNVWIREVRRRLYVMGEGAWVAFRVHLYPDTEGWLEVFDEEVFSVHASEKFKYPATAAEVYSELVAFPRRLENIPEWMLERLRAEDVPPPYFNEELQAVEFRNRRRPVTASGTDFSTEPTIIDPSLEPGVFAKIGKKLFGN